MNPIKYNDKPLWAPQALVFQLFAVAILLGVTAFFVQKFDSTKLLIVSFGLFVIFFFNDIFRSATKASGFYCILMLIAFVFHSSMNQIESPFNELIRWLSPIFLLTVARYRKIEYSSLAIAAATITVVLIGLDLFEGLTHTHPIEYKDDIIEGFANAGELDDDVFRAFGLLGHPLDNANILSLILAFVYASGLRKWIKWGIIALGFLALIAVNSRAAMVVWLLIFVYAIFLRGRKWYVLVVSAVVLLIAIPYFVEYVGETNALGRLDFDFKDDSTIARIESLFIFGTSYFNSDEIIMGGNLLYMPGTDLLLENGLLLNMGYWGWIIGPLKFFLEIFICYSMLRSLYNGGDKLVIMAGSWGVAMFNNNAFNPTLLCYFAFMYVAFNGINAKIAGTFLSIKDSEEDEEDEEEEEEEEAEDDENSVRENDSQRSIATI